VQHKVWQKQKSDRNRAKPYPLGLCKAAREFGAMFKLLTLRSLICMLLREKFRAAISTPHSQGKDGL